MKKFLTDEIIESSLKKENTSKKTATLTETKKRTEILPTSCLSYVLPLIFLKK